MITYKYGRLCYGIQYIHPLGMRVSFTMTHYCLEAVAHCLQKNCQKEVLGYHNETNNFLKFLWMTTCKYGCLWHSICSPFGYES